MAKDVSKNASAGDMLDAAAGLISKPVVPAGQPADTAAPVSPAAPVTPVEQVGAPVIVKSPLGDQVYGGKPISEVKLTSFADVQAFAKDVAGVEIKTVQDLVPVLTSLKTLQKNAAEAEQKQKIIDTYKNTLDNLPQDVSLILTAAINNTDYMSIIQKLQQKAVFDFEKPFDSHNEEAIINHYTGKGYTKETLDALTPDAREALKSAAKLQYKTDQTEFVNLKANTRSAIDNKQKSFSASVESSINQMLAGNPGMEQTAVERVRQIMTSGLGETLFTKEKTYLPDAAEKIAYMTFGKSIVTGQAATIGDLVTKMKAAGESQATERILLRGDKPILKGGGAAGDKNVLQAIVEKETSFLSAR